jgi:hypothetical protein
MPLFSFQRDKLAAGLEHLLTRFRQTVAYMPWVEVDEVSSWAMESLPDTFAKKLNIRERDDRKVEDILEKFKDDFRQLDREREKNLDVFERLQKDFLNCKCGDKMEPLLEFQKRFYETMSKTGE